MIPTIDISISNYAGPMDLLLDLIRKNEINIYDIPINFITSEYLKALQNSVNEGIEIQVEFLYLASALLSIKTRMLLPNTETEEEDPRTNLVEQIIVYSQFKEASNDLSKLQMRNMMSFDKLKDPYAHMDHKEFIIEEDPQVLFDMMSEMFIRFQIREKEGQEEASEGIILKDMYKVEDLIPMILKSLHNIGPISLKKLVTKPDKQYIITSFLAILELLNKGSINFVQKDAFGDIVLEMHHG